MKNNIANIIGVVIVVVGLVCGVGFVVKAVNDSVNVSGDWNQYYGDQLEVKGNQDMDMDIGASSGNRNAEDYIPYVMYNGGYNSAKPIETSDTLTVGSTAAITGAVTLSSSLTMAGALSGVTTLAASGATNVGNLTYGAGILASSTSNNAETMPISYLTTYSSLDYTPGDLAVTLTLPATSTMTAFITTAGECFDFRLRNLDATAATSTTIAAGTGIDLVENENGDVVIEGGNEAQLKFCRESDTDVTVYVDEYIAAD